jgi:hypothetical protein
MWQHVHSIVKYEANSEEKKSFVTNVMHVFSNYFKTVYNCAVATLQTCIQEYPLQILAQAPDLLTEVHSFS